MHKRNTFNQGFTIVELLIVIVVIAILAAISVVAYTGIQNRAHNSTVKSEVAAARKLLELAKVDLDHYPAGSADFPTGFKFTKSAYSTSVNNAMYCLNRSTDSYALGVTSKSGTSYLATKSGIQENVAVTSTAVCAAVDTTWGGTPPVTTSTMHGYFPSGTAPQYPNGWQSGWTWTN